MNQKQRDILCRMLDKRAREIIEEVDRKLGTTEEGSGRYRYPKSVSPYNLTTDETAKSLAEKLSGANKKEWRKYLVDRAKLDKEEQKLKDRSQKLVELLTTILETNKNRLKSITCQVKNSVEQATIKIQFAEDVEQAKTILESLPTVEQLLS